MIGAEIVAKCLKHHSVDHVFGVVGIPVIEVAEFIRAEGIQFIAMRNEQSASYAANASGYLQQKPGVCLTVSGPGFVHALAGLANAQANCWPMLLISGSSDVDQEHKGAFQEFPQVEAARLYTKFSARPQSLEDISRCIHKAMVVAVSGRPGPVYIDLPGNLITSDLESPLVMMPTIKVTLPYADPAKVREVASLLQQAQRPLIIIGKGAAYCKAEDEMKQIVEKCQVPFLATPMGKGVVPDTHEFCINAARSQALQEADLIVLFGARLNWMLHFGEPPRFSKDVKFITCDISPEGAYLCGDLKAISHQLKEVVKPSKSLWINKLKQKCQRNVQKTFELIKAPAEPYMSYHHAYNCIKPYLKEAILVNEGANTMDIGRTMIEHDKPRNRLDAGTFVTMGVGLGFAIAAQVVNEDKRVVCIQGDSAFGFGAMELETVCRLELPVVVIIINNNGIYSGMSKEDQAGQVSLPSTSLLADANYEMIAQAFGANGYLVKSIAQLENALKNAFSVRKPAVINCLIDPQGVRKQQEHSWLTRKSDSKL